MVKKYDYVIIGQGIAGSAFAWNLFFNNKSFIILDAEKENPASNASLGIYNPITGRRKAITWNMNTLFTDLKKFYSRVEREINENILFKKNISRPYKDNRDHNDWNIRESNIKFKNIIKNIDDEKVITGISGYIDVKKYLEHTRKYFKYRKRYKKYNLLKEDIIVHNNLIKIKGFNAKNIVMSIGIDQKNINIFNDIDLREVSGNSILIESNMNLDTIINKRISIINIKKNTFHIGSTYHNGPEDMGSENILDEAENILNKKLKLKKTFFGIRSTSKDRRPIVGRHSLIRNLYIINGLGSKGISQAPYCAKNLFNYIENNKELDKEINLKRFKT